VKVTLYFKSGLTGIYSGVGSVCTIQKGKTVEIDEADLVRSILAYDDEQVAMITIEPEDRNKEEPDGLQG